MALAGGQGPQLLFEARNSKKLPTLGSPDQELNQASISISENPLESIGVLQGSSRRKGKDFTEVHSLVTYKVDNETNEVFDEVTIIEKQSLMVIAAVAIVKTFGKFIYDERLRHERKEKEEKQMKMQEITLKVTLFVYSCKAVAALLSQIVSILERLHLGDYANVFRELLKKIPNMTPGA